MILHGSTRKAVNIAAVNPISFSFYRDGAYASVGTPHLGTPQDAKAGCLTAGVDDSLSQTPLLGGAPMRGVFASLMSKLVGLSTRFAPRDYSTERG